jgi:glycyl-radical enzyme activating protein
MDRSELIHGTLFDIQGFSVHDGPGCRTLIFFKGCSLHCAWCSNPEGISPHTEPLFNAGKCKLDLVCLAACPHDAITVDGSLPLAFDRHACRTCKTHACIEACLTGALRLGGFEITIDSLIARINRDRQYWGPGGGVTLTGGEPFAQPLFARELLKRCYEAYMHTAAETCGNVPWENIESSLPWLEWLFYDLKHMDPAKHAGMTLLNAGGDGGMHGHSVHERILDNARKLSECFEGRLIFRMPVITGFNDDDSNIDATARFMIENGRTEINVLPLHHMGREKYSLLGQEYYTKNHSIPSSADMNRIMERFSMSGITCYPGSETPF